MEPFEVFNKMLSKLAADLTEADEKPRPLLAHYCSTTVLESILRYGQLWLSNPLFMNDLEEVRFGIATGVQITQSSHNLKKALGSDARQEIFFEAFDAYLRDYSNGRVFDLYLTCFSAHNAEDYDGRLSMWRGYGSNGDGAAIVFDVNQILKPDSDFSGLVLDKVHYGTATERELWLTRIVNHAADLIAELQVADDALFMAAAALFERIKLMAIFSKHVGFEEEREWRLIYLIDRDVDGKCSSHLSYAIGPRGIEPKLKLPVNGDVPWHDDKFDLKTLIDRIILGPTSSSPLSKKSMERMFDVINLPELKERLHASSIPLRPIHQPR